MRFDLETKVVDALNFNDVKDDLITRLRSGNVDANSVLTNNGLTLLHFFAKEGGANAVEIVNVLLNELNVDVDSQLDTDHAQYPGCTALHLAVDKNDLDMVNKLLEYEPMTTIMDGNGVVPEIIAQDHGYGDISHALQNFDAEQGEDDYGPFNLYDNDFEG